MNGVEILSSNAVYNSLLPEWVAILFMILGVLVMLWGRVMAIERHYVAALVLGLLAVCISIVGAVGLKCDNKNSINYFEYNVTISDETSLKEFYNKYEIIEQNGEIFTVKERTNDR